MMKGCLSSAARSPVTKEDGPPPAGHPYQYSLVVDWLPMHPYQAEILLFTLEEFGRVPRDRIVVQCSARVTEEVRLEFERSGYRTSIFASCPDGMYSNEVARLDSLLEHSDPSANGFFLLNPGLTVLAPLEVSDPSIVWGKVADVPGPSLESLKRLFSEADLDLPNVVPCDLQEMGDTIATNMDGGFLYIPLPLASRLRLAWRRWAEFLLSRSDSCDDPSIQAHIGRISFAMALASERIPFSHLTANWNFPSHADRTPRTFRPEEYLRVLRYRENLDAFGLIASAYLDAAAVNAAVERINAAVGRRSGTMFFDMYKRHLARQALALAPAMTKETFSSAFVARTWIGDRKRRLILHAGTPKTGTGSLQDHLGANRSLLAEKGWWYPLPTTVPPAPPKHQKLVMMLLDADEPAFVEYLESALREMPDHAHTVILSTEGIFNHWWDYTPEAKGLLRHLAALFDFELCVWFRTPKEFAASYYLQVLKNNRTASTWDNVYGRDIGFTDAMQDGWFCRHFDYLGFVHEARELFGHSRVKVFPYTADTVRTFLEHYGIDVLPASSSRRNVSMRQPGMEMMRIANRYELDGSERGRVVDLVREADAIIGERAEQFRLSEGEMDLLARYGQRGWGELHRFFCQDTRRALREVRRPIRRDKVFCIGFGKTGTVSMLKALEILGYDTREQIGVWDPHISTHALGMVLAVATEFDAFKGNPWTILYKELDGTFPGSKFILTMRPAERWLASAVSYFRNSRSTPMKKWIFGYGLPHGNEDAYIERYNRHNQTVIDYFSGRDRDFLIMNFEAGDGWIKLCDFLERPVPNDPFPHLNRTRQDPKSDIATFDR